MLLFAFMSEADVLFKTLMINNTHSVQRKRGGGYRMYKTEKKKISFRR